MRRPRALLTAWAALLEWDVPFLPSVEVDSSGAEIFVHASAPGKPLGLVRRWPRQARVGVAAQLVALATFLFDQGWFPARRLLRSVRVLKGPEGVWVRLSRLPAISLHHRSVRLREHQLPPGRRLLPGVLAPFLAELLPEGVPLPDPELEGIGAAELLRSLQKVPRAGNPWAHPAGPGRFLWGRRLALPERGVAWVEEGDEDLLARLRASALLAASGEEREIAVFAGHLSEPAVSDIRTRAAMENRDLLVLTPIPDLGAVPVGLRARGLAVWGVSPAGTAIQQHLDAALLSGRTRAALAADILRDGALDAFGSSPQALATQRRRRCGWLSNEARSVLGWLEQAPAGLTPEEVEHLLPGGAGKLSELERLGLAWREEGVWRAVPGGPGLDLSVQQGLAELLPEESPRRLLALALAGGSIEPLASWCEKALESGWDRQVQELAGAVPAQPRLHLLAAEAALNRGRLLEAAALLAGSRDPADPGVWQVLEAWRADLAGEAARAVAALESADGRPLPARIQDRATILLAEQARRMGGRGRAEALLRLVEEAGGRYAAEAGLLRAALNGADGLRRWRKGLPDPPSPGLLARTMYLRSGYSFDKGCWPAAVTGLRSILRWWRCDNLMLLADVHGDLGAALLGLERPIAAERHLQVAEQLYARCGSRRDHAVVRSNRAVAACDGLELETARELIAAVRATRGEVGDAAYWLDEAELARIAVGRGDLEGARKRLLRIETSNNLLADHPRMDQALAVVRGHLALAEGDLEEVWNWADRAEDGERRLFLALLMAAEGVAPPPGLPLRWGMLFTAAGLAALVGGDSDAARREIENGMRIAEREAAMGLARLFGILSAQGSDTPCGWEDLTGRAAAVLEENGMAGWRRHLQGRGSDLTTLFAALDELLGAADQTSRGEAWKRLACTLGLAGVEVLQEGRSLVAWGSEAVHRAVIFGGLEIRTAPQPTPEAKAALEFTVSRLPLAACPAEDGGHRSSGTTLIGSSAALAEVRRSVARFASLDLTVLIVGEPGTGKELVARELHRQSDRPGPWEAVNCAALPEGLLEPELFGVVRGAFTGADRDRPGLVEAAEGGTLFLDEIGELPLPLQAKLLRLLQQREMRRVGSTQLRKVNVRFLAATNRDLLAAVDRGEFRRDLYDRLSMMTIVIPPLRERPEDVIELAQFLVTRCAGELRRPGVRLSAAAAALLARQLWPGNVRELESSIIRAVVAVAPGELLEERHFAELTAAPRAATEDLMSWKTAKETLARHYFEDLIARCDWNMGRAAEVAGITRQALYQQLRRLGISSSP